MMMGDVSPKTCSAPKSTVLCSFLVLLTKKINKLKQAKILYNLSQIQEYDGE